jgi:ABC-2 type transport system ATP-binding protein
VLSDAEALCNRVAILSGGRLLATGTIAELGALRARGWELVVAGVSPVLLDRYRTRFQRATPIAEGRYALELPVDPPPDQLLSDLISAGAHLVSLNPLRETLEDIFIERLQHDPSPGTGGER